jgi:hypothetical protein
VKSSNRRALSGMASTIAMRRARAATQAERGVVIKDATAKEPLERKPPLADDSVVYKQGVSTNCVVNATEESRGEGAGSRIWTTTAGEGQNGVVNLQGRSG